MGTPGGREELGSAAPSLSPCRLPSCLWFSQPLLSRCFQVCGAVTMYKGAIRHQLRGLHPAYPLQRQCRGKQTKAQTLELLCTWGCLQTSESEQLGRGSQSEERPTPLQTIHLLGWDGQFPMQGAREAHQVEWWVGGWGCFLEVLGPFFLKSLWFRLRALEVVRTNSWIFEGKCPVCLTSL